jgi:SAM-dependent methyltransferase
MGGVDSKLNGRENASPKKTKIPSPRTYFPATGWDWLLPIYDPLAKLLGGDSVRRALVDQLSLAPGHRVLDIGCGTGSQAVLIKEHHPGVAVVGLDPDPKALARAGRKAERAGIEVHLDRGFSDQLPYSDASFDRVCCTGMFSLIPREEKETTLREVRRVLRPGGSFHLLDLVKTPRGSFLWPLVKPGLRFEVCNEDQTIALMHQAGLTNPRKTGQFPNWFWPWPLASYQASR